MSPTPRRPQGREAWVRFSLERPTPSSEQAEATVSSSVVPEFGPNDWFVEEKYQQFLADPDSLDPIWRDFFADTGSGNKGPSKHVTTGNGATPTTSSASSVPAPNGQPAPARSSAAAGAIKPAQPATSNL